MNKKGDLSIVILVIGIIAICFLAIFSFVKLKGSIDDNFLGIGLIETMNSIEEEQSFYGETNFEGNYGNLFERGNVKVEINDETINGVYIVKERGLLNLFSPEEKVIVNITYKK